MSSNHHLDFQTLAEMQTTLRRLKINFRRACDQIILMNKKLDGCSVRYKRAKSRGMKSFRYSLRLRLAVIEGVCNMYYEYATQKAMEVEKLRSILEGHTNDVISVSVATDEDADIITLAEMQTTLRRLEINFRRACDQIVLMNKKLDGCSVRYKRAKSSGMKSFRYPLRLRLAVIEGVRNMYYEYATQKAVEVEKLRSILEGHINDVISVLAATDEDADIFV